MQQPLALRFYNISFTVLLGVCILVPLIFLSNGLTTFASLKFFILFAGVLTSLVLWLTSQLIAGRAVFPKSATLLALAGFSFFTLIASFFSPNVGISLWGKVFSLDSFITVTIFTAFTFLVSVFAQEQKRLAKIFLTIFFSSVGVVLLQIVLFLIKDTQIAAPFLHVAFNGTLVGNWVDFSFFTSFTFILSLLMVEVLAPSGIIKRLSQAGVIITLLALIFLNFSTAWLFVIISALLVFVYKASVERVIAQESSTPVIKKFPITSFVSLILGLFFLIASGATGPTLTRISGLSFTDIRPSFSATTAITKSALRIDPVFGGGPARFSELWEQYKTTDINNSIFWDTRFDMGFSTITTFFTTHGLLPTLLLITSFVLILILGFKLFNSIFVDRFTRFIAVASLILLLPFITLTFLGTPSIVLLLFGFALMGMLIGVSVQIGKVKTVTISYLENPQKSFFVILVGVVISLFILSGIYFTVTRFASTVFYQRGFSAQTYEEAVSRVTNALKLTKNDLYWKTLTELNTSTFISLLGQSTPDQAAIQAAYSQAEVTASQAIFYDGTNASNWANIGNVYKLLVTTNNPEAIKNTDEAFTRAITLSPSNPRYKLLKAGLYIQVDRRDEADALITEAIALKPDYLDAYVARAQLRQRTGNFEDAHQALVEYTTLYPSIPEGYYALGLLELDQKKYSDALISFNRARSLNQQYLDAYLKYVATLRALGRNADAIKELEKIAVLFPNLSGVDAEIEKLKTNSSSAE